MRVNYWRSEGWEQGTGVEAAGISIAKARKLLKERGGRAFTGFFEIKNRKYNLVKTEEISLIGQEVKA
jgi:hypothetical protein